MEMEEVFGNTWTAVFSPLAICSSSSKVYNAKNYFSLSSHTSNRTGFAHKSHGLCLLLTSCCSPRPHFCKLLRAGTSPFPLHLSLKPCVTHKVLYILLNVLIQWLFFFQSVDSFLILNICRGGGGGTILFLSLSFFSPSMNKPGIFTSSLPTR